jgi:mannose-6-phosphate isomerase-like protein (cupin superfamily)
MISPFKLETEFYFPEGCYIVEIHNRDGDEDCSIVRARVEPGVTTKLHAVQGTVERYVILEGEGLVEIDRQPAVLVKPLDVVVIPPGVPQRITNIGQSNLLFLAICTPRFREHAYIDLSAEEEA